MTSEYGSQASETLVRRSVWGLEQEQPWHPILLGYAQAVRELQQRADDNQTSWVYQAAIHGTSRSPVEQGWNQCQHGAWFFLPWHRLYLYYVERIIRSVVVNQGGPEDWALPYWDYDAGGDSNTLPSSFREQTLPDGTENPLFVTNRNPAINAGGGLPPQATSAATAMAMGNFLPPPLPGFGGGQTNGPQHFFNAFGALEMTPHNVVHVLVGGLMSNPNTAALDPIFWLHHSNIDRLWMEWNAGGGDNPKDSAWTDQTFELFDENGSPETRPLRDTEDPIGVLGYRYDTVSPERERQLESEAMSESPSVGSEPEMVGATEESVVLAGGSETVDVPVDARAARDALESVTADDGGRLYLSLEHVDADTTPEQAYGVYLEAPGSERRYHVGNLALFGIEQLHEERGEQGPHHQRFVFDVTDVAAELGGPGAIEAMRVTFEQLTYETGAAVEFETPAPEVEVVPITVGRVTLRRG